MCEGSGGGKETKKQKKKKDKHQRQGRHQTKEGKDQPPVVVRGGKIDRRGIRGGTRLILGNWGRSLGGKKQGRGGNLKN